MNPVRNYKLMKNTITMGVGLTAHRKPLLMNKMFYF